MSDDDPAPDTAAPRRAFLRRVGALAATPLLAPSGAEAARAGLEPWRLKPGAPFSTYGAPAPAEGSVQRWPAADPAVPGNGVSWSPLHDLDGSLTPNGLHFERHHNGVPAIEPAVHELRILGLVERALGFSIDTLLGYPRVTRRCFIECGGNSNAGWRERPVQAAAGHLHGLVSCSEWTGVPLATVLREAGLKAAARWLIAEGADAFSLTMSVPLEKALDDCLLVLYQNGERLRPEQGYPLRLLVPGWEGVLNVKWLTALHVSAEPAMTRNETARYTELQPDGRARAFTFIMEPKSLITWPSAGVQLTRGRAVELRGLAWSGHGAVATVEVSTDAGGHWQPARLDGPVVAQAWTRFRLPWRWDGTPAVLQSRVTDDSGRAQPARADLIAARGRAGYFHYNAIVSWAVDEDGAIRHVYPDAPAAGGELDDLFLDEPWD